MKVKNMTLLMNISKDAKFGEFKLTQEAQVIFYVNKENKVKFEIEYLDETDITYMGMPVDDFRKTKKYFKETLGIDLNEAFNKIFDTDFTTSINDELLRMVEKVSPILLNL